MRLFSQAPDYRGCNESRAPAATLPTSVTRLCFLWAVPSRDGAAWIVKADRSLIDRRVLWRPAVAPGFPNSFGKAFFLSFSFKVRHGSWSDRFPQPYPGLSLSYHIKTNFLIKSLRISSCFDIESSGGPVFCEWYCECLAKHEAKDGLRLTLTPPGRQVGCCPDC